MTEKVDARLLALASEVTESSNENVPVLLLKLKEILQSTPAGSKDLKKLKESLYNYDLLQYCVLVLKQDYSRVRGGWGTAANLADILGNCCVGLDPKEDSEEFYSKLLPSAILNMLVLARRIQARFVRTIKDEEGAEFFRNFRMVTDSICRLCSGHFQLTEKVLQQEHFLQLLMTDDVETGSVVLSVLQSVVRANRDVLAHIEENALHAILDELIYKLSASSNPVTGVAATRSLLLMAESNPDIVQVLGSRYKGLRGLLSKQWTGKGFGRELSRLLDLLYNNSYRQEGMQRLHNAACVIQAVWRGFQTRKRMKKLPNAVTTLQRGFRAKREQEMINVKRQKEEEELKQQLHLQRLRAMRMFRERQLTLMEIVHAGKLDKHIQEIQEKSALAIQKHWRGHKERKGFHQQKLLLKQCKAAVTIQRAALRFLNKRRKIRESLVQWKKPEDLQDEQRLQLQKKLDSYVEMHPAQQMSAEQSKELHLQAQEKLGQYLLKRKLEHKADQRREALLAQINTDINMMMGAPNFATVTEKDLDMFTSRSVPVAVKAKQAHSTMLKRSRWPWWKKLSDEYIEDDDDLLSNISDMEHGIIFIAGSKSS